MSARDEHIRALRGSRGIYPPVFLVSLPRFNNPRGSTASPFRGERGFFWGLGIKGWFVLGDYLLGAFRSGFYGLPVASAGHDLGRAG
jgi:hypothetical protein